VEILIIVCINVLFLVAVYYTLSRKIARIEARRLPQELEEEMSSIITSFNSTADRNIDLLDDRLRKLEPLTARAEKLGPQLEGLVRRAEAVSKMRELMQTGEARGSPPPGTNEGTKQEAERPAQSVAEAYKNAQAEAARIAAGRAQQEVIQKKAAPGSDAPEPEKKTRRKASRKRKTPDEILLEMTEAGDDPSEIARALAIPREEVLLKQKFLKLKR